MPQEPVFATPMHLCAAQGIARAIAIHATPLPRDRNDYVRAVFAGALPVPIPISRGIVKTFVERFAAQLTAEEIRSTLAKNSEIVMRYLNASLEFNGMPPVSAFDLSPFPEPDHEHRVTLKQFMTLTALRVDVADALISLLMFRQDRLDFGHAVDKEMLQRWLVACSLSVQQRQIMNEFLHNVFPTMPEKTRYAIASENRRVAQEAADDLLRRFGLLPVGA